MLPIHHGPASIESKGPLAATHDGKERVTERREPMPFARRSVSSSLRLSIFFAFWLSSGDTALPQLRDSFEGPERTWQISKDADCGVRVLVHDRPFRESHSGQSCEHFRL